MVAWYSTATESQKALFGPLPEAPRTVDMVEDYKLWRAQEQDKEEAQKRAAYVCSETNDGGPQKGGGRRGSKLSSDGSKRAREWDSKVGIARSSAIDGAAHDSGDDGGHEVISERPATAKRGGSSKCEIIEHSAFDWNAGIDSLCTKIFYTKSYTKADEPCSFVRWKWLRSACCWTWSQLFFLYRI